MEPISAMYPFPDTMIDFNGFNANGTVWVGVVWRSFKSVYYVHQNSLVVERDCPEEHVVTGQWGMA